MMLASIFSFALKSIYRQRVRTLATLSAISVGVAGLILAGGFVQDIFFQLGEAIIHSQTGHIQITVKGYAEGKGRSLDKFLIADTKNLQQTISASSPSIVQTTARLGFSGVLNNGKRDLGIIGEGIEPDVEQSFGTHMRFTAGRALKDSDEDAIIVGDGVANALGLNIGDRVTLVITLASGALNTLDFQLVGVFQSFSKEFDARAVRIPLRAAQILSDTASSHVIVAMLDKTEATTVTVNLLKTQILKNEFAVTPWSNLSDFYEKTVELYDRQFGVLRLITLVMVFLSVVNSVNMTLFERTREFGTMKAVGDTENTIFRLILAESVWLGALGSILGIILGCVLALGISTIGISMPPPPNSNLGYIAQIRLDAWSVGIAGATGFVACILASILPARRASQLDIVDALRHGV